jgi:hypothetical protein
VIMMQRINSAKMEGILSSSSYSGPEFLLFINHRTSGPFKGCRRFGACIG